MGNNLDELLGKKPHRVADHRGMKRTNIYLATGIHEAFARACRANGVGISKCMQAMMLDFIQRMAYAPSALQYVQFGPPQPTPQGPQKHPMRSKLSAEDRVVIDAEAALPWNQTSRASSDS